RLCIGMSAVRVRGLALPVLALRLSLAAHYPPLAFQSRARSHPPINDITTDAQDPPRYMTMTRAYPGAEMARQQRAAYPDIAPVVLAMPPAQAFAKAVSAAEAMGREVGGRDGAAGPIRAGHRTQWVGP